MPSRNNDSECQTNLITMSVKLRKNDSEHHKREDMVALNAKLKRDDSECRIRE